MSTDRQRGTMLRILDPERLGAQALGHLKVIAPDADWVEAKPIMRYAGYESAKGLFVVCTEGVGWEVTSFDPLNVQVNTSWREDGKVHRSISGSSVVHLSPYEVRALMEAGEDIDLADLVRSFGDRLEGNFWLWHRRFAKPKTKAK